MNTEQRKTFICCTTGQADGQPRDQGL